MLNPDFESAQEYAYTTVTNSNQKELPLSIKKIIRCFPNLHLQKYTVFAKKKDLTLQETFRILDSKDGCLWKRSDNTYVILYNDTISNTGRVRFTLAHELGHFMLKHHENTDKTILSRYSLSDNEYDIFEKEANYFAKRLLAPIPLIDLYLANWNEVSAENIERAFDVSYTVSKLLIQDLKKRHKNTGIIRVKHPMVNNFIDFINKDTKSKICSKCQTLQFISNQYCSNCGANKFVSSSPENYPTFKSERKLTMNYSKIELDEEMMPMKCPRCGYEKLERHFEYCPICSIYIHNVCLGPDWNKIQETCDGEYELTIKERYEHSTSCNGSLNGDCRYCPHCGAKTSYFTQELLTDWREEKEINILPF